MPGPINTAILGTGIALNHLHWPLMGSLPDMFNVTTVMERKMAGVAKSVCGKHIKVVATLDEVLADPNIELVVVATSDKTHYDYCTKSLLAGKHGMNNLLSQLKAAAKLINELQYFARNL